MVAGALRVVTENPVAKAGSAALLNQWLGKRVSPENLAWLALQSEKIKQSNSDRDLHITLGLIPRKLSRADLALSDAEHTQAEQYCAGWNPAAWSIDTTARIAVLCTLAEHNNERFENLLADLFRNADLAESIAYYSGIALYPRSDALDWQVGEGLRSNIRAVFEAIAHCNPYPALHFDQNRWNHMVLKALFIDSTLAPVFGLDQRANKELALILTDYAHERWAAGRPVSPELWRCVGRFAKGDMIEDLKRVVSSADSIEQQAGALALFDCADENARAILNNKPELVTSVSSGALSWDTLKTSNITTVA